MNEEQRSKVKEYYDLLQVKRTKLRELDIQIDRYNNILESFNADDEPLTALYYQNRLWALEYEKKSIEEFLNNVTLGDYINCKHEMCLDLGERISSESYSVVRYFKCLDCGKDIEFTALMKTNLEDSNYYLKEYFNDLMNNNLSCDDVKKNAISRYRYRSKNYDYKINNN